MKARLPHPQHYSYLLHRKQVFRQILLPVLLAFMALIALVVVIVQVAFVQGSGDPARWAAISTIWILIPVMVAGWILLLVLIGLIYLLSRGLGLLPHYTGIAQNYVHRARGYAMRGADLVVKPILALDGFIENFRAFFGRILP